MNPTEWTTADGRTKWTCGVCDMTHRDFNGHTAREFAEWCCGCNYPDCGERKERNYVYCPEHLAADRHRRAIEMQDKERALPLVDPASVEWVYDAASGHWHDDLDDLVDRLWADDEGRNDWEHIIVHPGVEDRADMPCLYETVAEALFEQYEDDGWEHMPADVGAVLTAIDEWLREKAPVMWTANTRVRVDMAAAYAAYCASRPDEEEEKP